MTGSDAILDRLLRLHPKLIDLSLGRIEELLATLGDPHRALGRTIHVAGTNGKGSTITFLERLIAARGETVNRYTSPHLVRFHERIALGGEPIDEAALTALLDRVETANAGRPITFFEVTTAAAFLAFAERPADWTLIEVGLGGRFDATNVVPPPDAAVIAPVGMDHMEFLGDSLAGIAGEKAGIVKPGTAVVVSAPQHPEALPPIEQEAAAAGTPLLLGGRDWQSRADGAGIAFEMAGRRITAPRLGLAGRHQAMNAGTALATASALGLLDGLHQTAIAQALAAARWPARLQELSPGTWLDGAHNGHATTALAETLATWPTRPRLVVGMLANRKPADILGPLAGTVSRLVAVPIPDGHAGVAPADIAAAAASLGMTSDVADDVGKALAMLRQEDAAAPVVIAGSLYLAGAVLGAAGASAGDEPATQPAG